MRLWDVLALKISRKYWEGEGGRKPAKLSKKKMKLWISAESFLKKIYFK